MEKISALSDALLVELATSKLSVVENGQLNLNNVNAVIAAVVK